MATEDPSNESDASAPRAKAPEGRAETAGPEADAANTPPKKKGSPIAGILGFIAALGAGFFIGQWINNRGGSDDVELESGARYKVELRGDEPTRGPEDALVTIVEFADYQCPYCAKAAVPLDDVLEDYEEDVRLVYKHYPLPSHGKAIPAARAAWAAHQQGKFWPIHAWLFEHKAELTQLEAKGKELALDVPKLLADTASDAAAKAVDGDFLAGARIGVTGTPVFFVNGHRYVGARSAPQWRTIIEDELKQAERLVDAGTPRAQVYATLMQDAIEQEQAKKAGRRPGEPDPNVTYAVTVDDRPALGPADALVTVVVFSDFQCPFCARLATTAHELADKHPDVRVVFRNLPLPNHSRAREAARAALAAARQGKFWEMHDALFAEQKALSGADFSTFAEKIGLDTAQFASDVADAQIEQMIAEDETLATTFGVQSTPSAFVNGRYVRGAQATAVYDAIIEQERAKAQSLVDAGTPREQVYAKIMETAATSVAKGEG